MGAGVKPAAPASESREAPQPCGAPPGPVQSHASTLLMKPRPGGRERPMCTPQDTWEHVLRPAPSASRVCGQGANPGHCRRRLSKPTGSQGARAPAQVHRWQRADSCDRCPAGLSCHLGNGGRAERTSPAARFPQQLLAASQPRPCPPGAQVQWGRGLASKGHRG